MTADAVLTRPFWQSFVAMCENEYWKRARIVQEITLARYRVILLDDNELEWSKFATLVCFFDAENSHPSRSLQLCITKLKDSPAHAIIQTTGRETTSKWNPRPLRDLLQDQMDRLCFYPRDRIYSLLSLCDEKDHLVPDYGINHIELLFRTVVACNPALGLIDFVCQLIRILAINKASLFDLPSTRLAIEFKIFAWSPLETVELDTQGENSKAQSSCGCKNLDIRYEEMNEEDSICCFKQSDIRIPFHILNRGTPTGSCWSYFRYTENGWCWDGYWRFPNGSDLDVRCLEQGDAFKIHNGVENPWTVFFPWVSFWGFLIRHEDYLRRYHRESSQLHGYRFFQGDC